MSWKMTALLVVVFSLSSVGYRVNASCIPDYFQNAPDTLDSSDCGGFLPGHQLVKESHWTIIWTRPDGSLKIDEIDARGFGACAPRKGLFCWPLFQPPIVTGGEWRQDIWDVKMNCNIFRDGDGECTACRIVQPVPARSAISLAPCGTCGIQCVTASCDLVPCPPFEEDGVPPHACCYTPVLIDVAGDGFDLTDNPGGVRFDLDADGSPDHLSWTSPGSDDAWLALDRNQNGAVDDGAELFGNFTPQPVSLHQNGFIALAEYDKPQNGGNSDGRIDDRDAAFSSLRLWTDGNHDGASQPGEITSLTSAGIHALDLRYKESKKTDQYGNRFRYRVKTYDVRGAQVGRWAWDVFLVHRLQP